MMKQFLADRAKQEADQKYAGQCVSCGAGISAEGSWICWGCANKVKQCPTCGRKLETDHA